LILNQPKTFKINFQGAEHSLRPKLKSFGLGLNCLEHITKRLKMFNFVVGYSPVCEIEDYELVFKTFNRNGQQIFVFTDEANLDELVDKRAFLAAMMEELNANRHGRNINNIPPPPPVA
jgi:hypothetical protein